MTQFARCFLLVFTELGVGGLLALAIPPFHEIERGYYKSSAGVFLTAALAGTLGTIYLALTRDAARIPGFEVITSLGFVGLFCGYLASLWGEAVQLRARLYAGSLLSGLLTLAIAALNASPSPSVWMDGLAVINAFAQAAVLGSVTAGMLIGHWYLIDPGMEIEPFVRCFRYYAGTLMVELSLLAVTIGFVAMSSTNEATAGLVASAHLLGMRVVLGPLAGLAMAALLRRVLAIPQTMAATGLFYVATLAILVGEFLGRFILFRTGLPL